MGNRLLEFLSFSTGENWTTTDLSTNNKNQDNEDLDKLNQLILNLLLSENLVILCGLGTSLCLKDSKGQHIAPTMADLWKAVKDKANQKSIGYFEEIIDKVKYSLVADKNDNNKENIELLLSRCQLLQQLQPDTNLEEFITEAEAVIVDKCRFVEKDLKLEEHEAFLRKVARRSPRLPRTKIFTTNYDLCFETAASHSQFVIIDGFSHTYPQEFDGSYFDYDIVRRDDNHDIPDYITNVFHLYKIHGSVDWAKKGNVIIKDDSAESPCIIYPRQGKYQSSYEQPFLEMMSRFQMTLRQPNIGLLIIGFGFNDLHIVRRPYAIK